MTTADVSLGLPGSLSRDSSVPSMGVVQTSLYSWYPLTTLYIVNACTIFRGTRDDKINDRGLFKFSVAHCNYREEKLIAIRQSFPRQLLEVTNSPKFSPATVLRYTVYAFDVCCEWRLSC